MYYSECRLIPLDTTFNYTSECYLSPNPRIQQFLEEAWFWGLGLGLGSRRCACQRTDTHVFRDRRFCSQLCLIFNCLSFPLKKSYNNFGPQVF